MSSPRLVNLRLVFCLLFSFFHFFNLRLNKDQSICDLFEDMLITDWLVFGSGRRKQEIQVTSSLRRSVHSPVDDQSLIDGWMETWPVGHNLDLLFPSLLSSTFMHPIVDWSTFGWMHESWQKNRRNKKEKVIKVWPRLLQRFNLLWSTSNLWLGLNLCRPLVEEVWKSGLKPTVHEALHPTTASSLIFHSPSVTIHLVGLSLTFT